ncbi:uncharacterized protein LOC112135541 [Pongo abelii]|uniref:uncharacterized protein LOC112135541 n=1 Tax=Pongo abelii TaxID=9601 RepID=UPI0023E1B2C9|nr:uncharacterized protein LOC129007604 [Pongo pygmaeus]XP_054379972.1 uncharacterized protein LOC112135541 [Pongo abelii]
MQGEILSLNRRNLKVWVQSLRSYTGSTRGHSSWTGSSRAYSSWTGSSHKNHSPPWSPHRSHSWSSSRWAHSSWSHSPPWSPHRSHSPPWNPHRSHNPPWSPHKSHNPLWSPHRSHSWSRNRLAHSSTRACSSRLAQNSWSHSQSHSPHSRNHSPHSHSSPWFWWIEGGAGRGAGEREVQVWSSLSLGSLYTCPDVRHDTGSLSCDCLHCFSRALFFSPLLVTSSWLS